MDIPRFRCAHGDGGSPYRLTSCLHSAFCLCIWLLFSVCLSAIIAAEDEVLIFMPTVDKQKNLFVDDKFVVTCYPREGTNAHRVTWKGPIGEITGRTGRIHVEESKKFKGMDLFFDGIKTRDQGIYKCTAMVDNREVVKHLEILVFRRISFVDEKPLQYLQEGGDESILCEARAYPDPQVTWKINGNDIIEGKHVPLPNELRVRNVSREDAGTYTCRATQMEGTISDFQDLAIKVVVLYKPDWKDPMLDTYYSYIGGVVNLTCDADAEPTPTYSWDWKSNSDEKNDNYQIYSVDGKSILEVRIRNETDFDNYTCSAKNNQGDTSLTIQLLQGATPEKPQMKIKNVNTHSMTLEISMESDGELDIISYVIQFKLEGQTWEQGKEQEFMLDKVTAAGKNRFKLENLEASTVYVLRAAARNPVGLGDFSDDVSQKTEEKKAVTSIVEPDSSSNSNRSSRMASSYFLMALGVATLLIGLAL